ncbi:hypothetical protein [uncultured Stenotrophomonas sp.]|uniref:hypothetical protein n=1 Tax=uncultured Stenotrophomonas sp. TaxID=165438 RepID=UPI0028E9FBB9|nr:hypothetical protein [uncultured Stenotrophomonas sp.]
MLGPLQGAGRTAAPPSIAVPAPVEPTPGVAPVSLRNGAWRAGNDAAEVSLTPALTRLLRRCPLLPAELTRVEAQLHEALAATSPEALGMQLANMLKRAPLAARPAALDAALAAQPGVPMPAADAWQQECTRVIAALLDGLGQLQCTRAAGLALYAVGNAALGPEGARLLAWSQQAVALPRLLGAPGVLPWLVWLCQLPLPSLRGGAWVEPLVALLPHGLEVALQQAATAHHALHRGLELPSAPLRLLLLGTAWVLWFRQQPTAPPTTRFGQQVARLPAALDQLDRVGTGARALFAPAMPAPADAGWEARDCTALAATGASVSTHLLHPALPMAMAGAATLPALAHQLGRRRGVALATGVAAATAGAGLAAWALNAAATPTPRTHGTPFEPSPRTGEPAGIDVRYPASRRPARSLDAVAPAQNEAAAQDQVALIEALWTLRDAAVAQGSAMIPGTSFSPAVGSPFAMALLAVREQLGWLYRQDDFQHHLYGERTPPSTIRVADGQVHAARAISGTVVQLHPQFDADGINTWSTPTEVLLLDLQRIVRSAGGCFDNAVPGRLDCALGFYLGHPAPTSAQRPLAIDSAIQQLERLLQLPDGQTAATNETTTLLELHQQVRRLKAAPIRGLEPIWRSWRPDPRSHLGHNMALARSLLLQVSQHADVIALCWHHHADPAQLEYPAHGPVLARGLQDTRSIPLFDAGDPPAALASIDSLLRGIATLLHAPVRSEGRLRTPEMLAYYAAPLPAAPIDDAPFDTCLAALERQLAPPPPPVSEPRRAQVEWDERSDVLAQQDHQRLLSRLWERFDALPRTWEEALERQSLSPTASSPLLAAWRDAQQQLRHVYEQPAIWLEMRRQNATFPTLRVGADGLTAQVRGGGRSVIIADGLPGNLAPPLSGWLEALYRMTDRLGRFSPGTSVPLGNALQFHGALPPPSPAPCAVPTLCTHARLLQAIARVQERWLRHDPMQSAWRQASNELRDLAQLLSHHPDATGEDHRAALGTTTTSHQYPALHAFATLLASPGLQAALQRTQRVPRWIGMDIQGGLVAQDAAGAPYTLDGNDTWLHDPDVVPQLATLRAVASQLGGQVRSDSRVSVSDILTAHGGCGPEEETHFDGAARCVERLLAELRLGMRADLLHAWDALDATDLAQVRATSTAFLAQRAPGDQTLLEYLARPLVERGEMAWDEVHRTSHFIAAMARTPRAQVLQTALLRALGWYQGSLHAPTSPTLLASLTRVAIVLDLGPPSNRDARVLLGYRLHKPSNWGRTFASIRLDFHDYLRSMGRIPDSMLGMATTLALQDAAPELLIRDVPPNLVYANTIASIHFVSGVHLAERIRRGLSQQMRFSELLTLSVDLLENDDVPELVKRLALHARRLPTQDWYVFRQLERGSARPMRRSERMEAALLAFDQRVADIERAVVDVLAPLPYRMPLVEAEIHRLFPKFPGVLSNHAWNSTEFLLCHDDNHFGRSFPFFELVAAGALRNGSDRWRPCRTFVPDTPLNHAQGNPRYEAALQNAYAQMKPALPRLADINARFQRRFDAYFRKAQRGYGVLIEEALYQRPEDEREALLRGDVQVFTLRTHEPDLEAQQETRNDTDPYRGRFGVVYTLTISGRPRHFQLFPLQSRIVPLDVDGPLPLGGELQKRKVRLRSGNMATVHVRRGTPLPVDWLAFSSDKAPADGMQSAVIVEPLLAPPRADDHDNATRSPFHALVDPIQSDFFWLDRENFHREGMALTGYEQYLAGAPLWLSAVDFIVPFVENLRRITSKDRNEFSMAAFGLYLEAIIVVGPVVSGMAKVLARPGLKLTVPRFTELSKVLGRGTVDALNPAAGSVALLRVGVSVVQRTARGRLRFLWTFMGRQPPPARTVGLRWAMREGMAIAKEGGSLASPLYEIKVRTVNGIPGAMVSPPPLASASSSRTLHLVDPATLTLYGPALQEPLVEGGNAAGMLIKVGGSPRTPHVSPGKALKPIKQGGKTSDEEGGDEPGALQPPVVVLPDHRALGVPATHR